MAGPDSTGSAGRSAETAQLLAEETLLALPATEQLLADAARAAADGVGLSCGITYVARYGAVTVASSDALASAVDEIQYSAGDGPCLEALRTGEAVPVDDQAADRRWGPYPRQALAAGVRSSLSLPLVSGEETVGALNVYSVTVGPIAADQEAAAILAGNQVTGILIAVRRMAANLLSDPDAIRRFQDRHELDVATGVLMSRHGCTFDQARDMLIAQAADERVSVPELVARTIAASGPGSGSPL